MCGLSQGDSYSHSYHSMGGEKTLRRFEAQEILFHGGSHQLSLSKHSSIKRYLVLVLIEKRTLTEKLAPPLCCLF